VVQEAAPQGVMLHAKIATRLCKADAAERGSLTSSTRWLAGWGGGLFGVTRLGDGGGQASHGFVDLRFRVLRGAETATDQT
jgi:hypothetical protein